MSGRNQHFIQKFLLQGFRSNAAAKFPQTWVYRRDGKVYSPALHGYGAERDFYGDPELDRQITEQESRHFTGFITDCRAGDDRVIDSDLAAMFAVQVFARCKSYRSMIADSLEPMMVQANATIRTVDFQTRMLVRAICENPVWFAIALTSSTSIEDFARQRVEQKHGETLALLRQTESGVRAAVADFQNRAIKERLDFSGSRRDSLRALHWRRVSVATGEFILGDSVVAAELADGTFKPVHEPADALCRIWLPVSAQQAIVGCVADETPVVDLAIVNLGAAACSYDAFCARSGPETHRGMISAIRTRTLTLTAEQTTAIVEAALKKLV